MSLQNIMNISGMSMDAQMVRINAAVSNIANADTQGSSADEAFKAKRVVFKAVFESEGNQRLRRAEGGVYVDKISEDLKPHVATYEPSHPLANEAGYVFQSNVDTVSEMVDITGASRAYESAVEASNTAKRLMSRTIEMLEK
jgi:flagellar basal-body rod protein FlgC